MQYSTDFGPLINTDKDFEIYCTAQHSIVDLQMLKEQRILGCEEYGAETLRE